jgi:hypothetical protein
MGYALLHKADDTYVLAEYLPIDSRSQNGTHTLNSAIDIQVAASQHIGVYLDLSSGTAGSATCTASGTLDTLG